MERGVEIFVAINFLVIGISHLIQPDAWVDFFKLLRSHGRIGSFANGFLSLSFGSIILSFHWVWDGVIPSIVTCLGLAQVIKSIVAFGSPNISLRTMHSPMAQKTLGYRVGGIICLAFSGLLMYHLW